MNLAGTRPASRRGDDTCGSGKRVEYASWASANKIEPGTPIRNFEPARTRGQAAATASLAHLVPELTTALLLLSPQAVIAQQW